MEEYYRKITTCLPPQFEQAMNDLSANEPDEEKEKDSFRQKVMEGRDIKPIPTYHEAKAKLTLGEENIMNAKFPTAQHAVKDITHLVPPRPVVWESLGETNLPLGDQGANRNSAMQPGDQKEVNKKESPRKKNAAGKNGNDDFGERSCTYTTTTAFPIISGMEEWVPNYESDSSSDVSPDTPLPSQKGSESGKKEKEDLFPGKRGQEIGWSGARKFRRLSNGSKASDETTDSEHDTVEVANDADGADRCQSDTVADAAPGQDDGHRVGAPESGREDSKADECALKQQMKMAVEDSFSAAIAHIRPVDEDDQMRDALYFKFLDDIFRAWHHFSFSSATLYTALNIYTKIVELRPYLRLVVLKICAPASLVVAARRCGKFYDHEAFWKVWRGGIAFRERLSMVEEQIELLLEPHGIHTGLSPHCEINKILTKDGINITVPQYCCALFYFDRSFCSRKNVLLTYEERAKYAIDLCFQEVDEIQADMRDMNSDIYCHNHIVKREGFLSKWRDLLEEYANMDMDTIFAFEYFLYKKEYGNGRFPATPARRRKRVNKSKDSNTQPVSDVGLGLGTTIVECIDLTENFGPEPSPSMLKLINEEYWRT